MYNFQTFVKSSSSFLSTLTPSRPNMSRSSSSSASVALFCNICKNNNKSVSEYTSHNTKKMVNGARVVVCPTILNSICTYCKEKGHFKSECAVLKKKNEQQSQPPSKPYSKQSSQSAYTPKNVSSSPLSKEVVAPKKKSANVFADAFDESDDDEDETIQAGSTAKRPKDVSFSYLSALSDNIVQDLVTKRIDIPVPTAQLSILQQIIKNRNLKHSWADDAYWESDNEDETLGGVYRPKPYVSNYKASSSTDTSDASDAYDSM